MAAAQPSGRRPAASAVSGTALASRRRPHKVPDTSSQEKTSLASLAPAASTLPAVDAATRGEMDDPSGCTDALPQRDFCFVCLGVSAADIFCKHESIDEGPPQPRTTSRIWDSAKIHSRSLRTTLAAPARLAAARGVRALPATRSREKGKF